MEAKAEEALRKGEAAGAEHKRCDAGARAGCGVEVHGALAGGAEAWRMAAAGAEKVAVARAEEEEATVRKDEELRQEEEAKAGGACHKEKAASAERKRR